MRTKDLTDQITATYKMLRLGLAVLAFAFPLILWLGGYLFGSIPLAGSMSEYYHATHPATAVAGNGLMRNEFVGILFAVGALLFAYQGYSRLEDYALDIAGILAWGIALFPMRWPIGENQHSYSLHGAFAITFFLCIAYVSIFRAADTLPLIASDSSRARYRRTYKILGWAMVLLPTAAWVLISIHDMPFHQSAIFCIELTGIYVFATYWVIKSNEAHKTDVDARASRGEISIRPHGFADLLRELPVTEVDGAHAKAKRDE
jgi:hypothetical protein